MAGISSGAELMVMGVAAAAGAAHMENLAGSFLVARRDSPIQSSTLSVPFQDTVPAVVSMSLVRRITACSRLNLPAARVVWGGVGWGPGGSWGHAAARCDSAP